MSTVHDMSRLYDHDGTLTHVMCCICFNMVPASEAWKDRKGRAWDLCGDICAAKAGAK